MSLCNGHSTNGTNGSTTPRRATSCGETADEFSLRVSAQVCAGLSCLGIAMGLETGLFETMIALGEKPRTSQEIAEAAKLKTRYVHEWLGCMAASDIVDFDPVHNTYWIPSHRWCILESSTLSMAIPCLAGGFFDVAACFKKDGPAGVDYDRYPKFDEVFGKLHWPFFRDQFLQEFIPSMPALHKQLKKGIRVLEVGCCEGNACRKLASQFPNSSICGIDFCADIIETARDKTAQMGLTNVEFCCEDASCMPDEWTWRFDYVFIYYVLHDLSYPAAALQEMMRVLKPGGALSVVDTVTHTNLRDNLMEKDAPYIITQFTLSLMNCLPLSMHPGDGAGLGAMWGREKARTMMEDANFEVISISETNAHFNGLHYQCRKPISIGKETDVCGNGVH